MSQDNLITLYCKNTGEHITTSKPKKNANKLELMKYSKKVRKRVKFIQTKKPFKKK